jgi:hypothetical protein
VGFDERQESGHRVVRQHRATIASTFPEIAVGPNEFANTWDVFGPLIEERLWPNPRYNWLSGVLHHRTNRIAPPSNFAYFDDFNPNPNAAIPAPETLMLALTGETEFHLMWQRPRRPEADRCRRRTAHEPVGLFLA